MSGARPDTWMPLYWGDYLKDTMHLSASEHGGYTLMIGAYWMRGGPLPNDDGQLQRITRMTDKEWRTSRETLLAFFTVDEDKLRHGRIDEELGEARIQYDKRLARTQAARAAKAPPTTPVTDPVTEDVTTDVTEPATEPVTTSVSRVAARQPQPQPQSPNGEKILRSQFEEWYGIYPRKKSPRDAWKAFKPALLRVPFDELMTKTRRFAANAGPDKTFMSYPASWLNGDEWLNEPDDAPTNGHVPPRDPDATLRKRAETLSAGIRLGSVTDGEMAEMVRRGLLARERMENWLGPNTTAELLGEAAA